MACVLVTGGAGFIGSHLVDRLLSQGKQVLCLDNFDDFYDPVIKRANLSRAASHARFTLVEGDIRDEALLRDLFSRHPIQRVVHLAARAGVRPSIQQPLLYQDVNVRGTLLLLEASKRHGVEQFVFASSSSVYGEQGVPFREEDPVDRPISPYAATKRAGELLCYTDHHLYGLPITCLRFFTVYGPRQRPDLAIHKFTRLIEHGQDVPMFGDGSSSRDYTYIDDIVDGVVKALEKPFAFEIINLGESRTISLKDMIRSIEDALGKQARIRQLPPQPGDVPATFADVSKGGRLLGYHPTTSFEDGLARFVDWFRQQAGVALQSVAADSGQAGGQA